MSSRKLQIVALGLISACSAPPCWPQNVATHPRDLAVGSYSSKKKPANAASKKERCGAPSKASDMIIPSSKKTGDRKHFKLSFQKFYKLRVSPGGLAKGRSMMRRHRKLLRRVYKRYGVQPRIITAIWSLETFYGGFTGDKPIFRSLATLSYDCRRSKMFTQNLYAALRVVQRGDLHPKRMKGAWAGELGQTQFMAKNYYRYAVDFDGDGKRNLIRSKADALASTANLLRAHGWKRGGCYHPGCCKFQSAAPLEQIENLSAHHRQNGVTAVSRCACARPRRAGCFSAGTKG